MMSQRNLKRTTKAARPARILDPIEPPPEPKVPPGDEPRPPRGGKPKKKASASRRSTARRPRR
jgi:hypothetical protein